MNRLNLLCIGGAVPPSLPWLLFPTILTEAVGISRSCAPVFGMSTASAFAISLFPLDPDFPYSSELHNVGLRLFFS